MERLTYDIKALGSENPSKWVLKRAKRKLYQNDETYNEKTECLVKSYKTKIYGIDIYEGYVNADKVYVCADDVY